MNALIQLTGDGYNIIATKEAEALKLKLLKSASVIKNVDAKTEGFARSAMTDLASFRKELEASRNLVLTPIRALTKEVNSKAEQFGQEVLREENRIKALVGSYAEEVAKEQARIEREAYEKRLAAQRAEEEAQRKRDEEVAARLKAESAKSAMAEAKAEKEAEARRLEAERLEREEEAKRREAFLLEQKAKDTRVKGASMVWDFQVEDIHALYKYNPSLVTMEPKRREILEALKALEQDGDDVSIPGIRAFKKPSVRA